MDIADIKPYTKNAKKHPSSQIKSLMRIVAEVGWRQPVLVNSQGVIVAGHGRFMAWSKYKEELPPLWVIDDKGKTIHGAPDDRPLTAAQEMAYRLADNKLNESDWDNNLIAEELKELNLSGFDIELTGFNKDLILEAEDRDDEIPTDVPARVALGDMWQLGKHIIMCGDSTNTEAVDKLLQNFKVDLIFTDPPYGVDYSSRVDKDRRKPWGGIKNDDLKGNQLIDFLQASLLRFKDATSYICCNWQSVTAFFESFGMPNSLIVWDKESMGLGANFRSQHEFILFYGKLNHRKETNVWRCKRDSRGDYQHPTQKPVELITRAITNSTTEGGGVLDLFGGSGSTLIAAEKSGRVARLMELDPKYVDVTLARFEEYTKTKAVKLENNGKKANQKK